MLGKDAPQVVLSHLSEINNTPERARASAREGLGLFFEENSLFVATQGGSTRTSPGDPHLTPGTGIPVRRCFESPGPVQIEEGRNKPLCGKTDCGGMSGIPTGTITRTFARSLHPLCDPPANPREISPAFFHAFLHLSSRYCALILSMFRQYWSMASNIAFFARLAFFVSSDSKSFATYSRSMTK